MIGTPEGILTPNLVAYRTIDGIEAQSILDEKPLDLVARDSGHGAGT
ncbi:hypothetical protein [Nocardioides sp. W7]|nr:hypothetical protein [Nocardioides sp. W7]